MKHNVFSFVQMSVLSRERNRKQTNGSVACNVKMKTTTHSILILIQFKHQPHCSMLLLHAPFKIHFKRPSCADQTIFFFVRIHKQYAEIMNRNEIHIQQKKKKIIIRTIKESIENHAFQTAYIKRFQCIHSQTSDSN